MVDIEEEQKMYAVSAAEQQLHNLLLQHNLEEYFVLLKSHNIDVQCFRGINEADIKEIFGDNIGGRIKFRHMVNEWRISNNLPGITTCCCHGIQQAPANRLQNATVSLVAKPPEPSPPSEFNIDVFLKSDIGKKIVKKYKEQKMLGEPERNEIISNIAREHLERDIAMNVKMFETVSEQIVKAFPNEKKEYYFTKYPKATGKLYNKYRSMQARFRSAGFLTSKRRNTELDTSNVPTSTTVAAELHIENSADKEWLSTENYPWELVENKWRATHTLRRAEILISSTEIILLEWPLLKQSFGHRLIEIDFGILQPEKTNALFSKWHSLEDKLVEGCKSLIKLPAAKQIINNLSADTELRHFQIFQCIIAVTKPCGRKFINGKIWKVSINDAWNAFAAEANTVADIQVLIENRRDFCNSHEISLHPFLIILKKGDEGPKFVLVYSNEIMYTFDTFLEAIDMNFKLVYCLNLSYPLETLEFWRFIQLFFYEVDKQNCQLPELNPFFVFLN